jgi:hypothetical protein
MEVETNEVETKEVETNDAQTDGVDSKEVKKEVQTKLRLRELKKGDWALLINRIRKGECTPFLGAGACAGTLPLAREVALRWGEDFDFPLRDKENLIQVAQFLAVDGLDPELPKLLLQQEFDEIAPPDFDRRDEIHSVLAELPLPMYITTNYDSFMTQALASRSKQPVQQLCHWWGEDVDKVLQSKARSDKVIRESLQDIFEQEPDFEPSKGRPIVFHMHGNTKVPATMVLTEDDYLDFLIKMGENKDLLPSRIRQAFTETSLLFLGYSLSDPSFRVVFRSLVSYMKRNFGRAHVSVQLTPDLPEEQLEKALRYLDGYFKELKIHVYWGTCQEFTSDLREKMGI